MIDDDDYELLEQRLAMTDTIAWDNIYARATAQARESGVAQLILEHGRAAYELVDRREPDALRVDRLAGAKVHVVLDWS